MINVKEIKGDILTANLEDLMKYDTQDDTVKFTVGEKSVSYVLPSKPLKE